MVVAVMVVAAKAAAMVAAKAVAMVVEMAILELGRCQIKRSE